MSRLRLIIVSGFAVALGAPGCTSTEQTARTTPAAAPAATPKPASAAPKAAERPRPLASADGTNRAAMYFPTGDRGTSALMLERVAPVEVRAGQEFDYTMRVTNLTSMNLTNVVVKDMCAANYTYIASNPSALGKPPEALTWGLGDLAPNAAKDISVKGKAAAAGGPVTNCASVSYNSMLCVSTNVVDPALKLVVSGPAEGSVCDNVCYVYKVTNSGTGIARDVRVNFALPTGWTTEKPDNNYAVGNLAPGKSAEFEVCAKPDKTGSISTTATATGSGGLSATGNTVNTVIKAPALALTAECPGRALIGRDMIFKFTVKNTGTMPATGTVITAPVPTNTTFVSADAGGVGATGKVTWNIAALAPNDSRTVTLISKSTGAGTITATASASARCASAVKADCSTSVQGVPDIGTGIQDEGGVRIVGETHVYQYTVINQGQVDLTGIKVVATLDESSDYISSNFTSAPSVAGRTITFNVGTVAIGQRKSFTIVIRGTAAGERGVETVTSSNELKRVVRNDEQVTFIDK